VNTLIKHEPGSRAIIRFANGERIAITIAPSGVSISKVRLRVLRGRKLFERLRTAPKALDRTLRFFMAGPDSDLPGDTVLELMASRILRECRGTDDVVRLCARIDRVLHPPPANACGGG
jgi:hypothetical protein